MKPELRQALDEEILKATPELQTFLNDQYFKDTLSLIERVNKLDADQAISLELEITMFLLGISDYPSVEEALRGELGQDGQVANEATVRQAVKDVDAYILSKIPKTDSGIKKVEIKTEEVAPQTSSNLHDILYKELDASKSPLPETTTNQEKTEEVVAVPEVAAVPVEPAKPLDFYREKIGDEEKKVKSL